MELKYNENLIWQSDWSGDETGHDAEIVGLWMIKDTDIHLYIDIENNVILEGWRLESDDEVDITTFSIIEY